MSALGLLLERVRRAQLAPGAPARAIGVPSAGDELSREVAFLFAPLDEIEQRGQRAIAAARADAARIESNALETARRLVEEAAAEAERQTQAVLAAQRSAADQRAAAMLADAQRDAAAVRARGRERIPALVDQVVVRLLDGAG